MTLTNILNNRKSLKGLTEKHISTLSLVTYARMFAKYLCTSACAFIVLTLYCVMHSAVVQDSDFGLFLSLRWSFDVLIFWFLAVPLLTQGIIKATLFGRTAARLTGYSVIGCLTVIFGLAAQSFIWDLDLESTLKLAFHFIPVALLIYASLLSFTLFNTNVDKKLSITKPDGQKKTSSGAPIQSLLVTKGNREQVIGINDISLISSAGNYVELSLAGEKYLYRSTLKSIFSVLEDQGFIQIHRKYIVQVKCIDSVSGLGSQSPSVTLIDGTFLPVGKRFKQRLVRMRKLDITQQAHIG